MKRFQRLTAFTAAMVLALPLSLLSETRSRQRTRMQELAAELATVLGHDSVEVRGASTPERTDPPRRRRSEAVSLSAYALVDEMNRYRENAGLAPLQLDERLNEAAADRVRDMFAQRYFDHVAPDGTPPFVWVRRHSYRYSLVGENLAAGYPSVRAVVAGWMNSPGHRANILTPGFRDVGIGMSNGYPAGGRISGPTVVALYAVER